MDREDRRRDLQAKMFSLANDRAKATGESVIDIIHKWEAEDAAKHPRTTPNLRLAALDRALQWATYNPIEDGESVYSYPSCDEVLEIATKFYNFLSPTPLPEPTTDGTNPGPARNPTDKNPAYRGQWHGEDGSLGQSRDGWVPPPDSRF